jgi:hypothetical protein
LDTALFKSLRAFVVSFFNHNYYVGSNEKEKTMTTKLQNVIVALAMGVFFAGVTAKADSSLVSLFPNHVLKKIQKGEVQEAVVKFNEGDNLPYDFFFEGDFLKTEESATSHLIVQRTFYLKADKKGIFMSLDGQNYKPVRDMVEGTLAFSAAGDGDEDEGVAQGVTGSLGVRLKK